MVRIDAFPITNGILEEIDTYTPSTVVQIIKNDPQVVANNYGITEEFSCNAYLTELYLFTRINTLAAQPLPDYLDTDSESDRLLKSINAVYGSTVPKFGVTFWLANTLTPTASNWKQRGMVAIVNQQGYPFNLQRVFDQLSDNVVRDIGTGFSLGVSLEDVGFGVPGSGDTIVLDGVWKQDCRIISPDYLPIVVQGATVQNVVANRITQSSTNGTTRKMVLTSNAARTFASIQNTHASNTMYLAYTDYTPTSTNNDGTIPANTTKTLDTSKVTSVVYSVASGAATGYTTVEQYNVVST